MKNWRKILVTGMVAGMIAVTGCSSNVPETNQGNRNGQRVVDAVNRRTDSYGLTRARNNGPARTTRGFNRGFRRAATRNNGTAGTRHHYTHPGLGANNNNQNRHHGLGTNVTRSTTRNDANRNSGAYSHGRVGHTFGYDHNGYVGALDNEYGGYDLGQRSRANSSVTQNVQRHNAANLNNRVVRSTPARNTATQSNTTTGSSVTRKSGTPTRNTATRSVQPTRKAAAGNTTRSTTHKTQPTHNTQPTHHRSNSVRPTNTVNQNVALMPNNATYGREFHPWLPNTTNTGVATRRTPARANRQSARRLSDRAERARGLHGNARDLHMQNAQDIRQVPTRNINSVVNPSITRSIANTRSAHNIHNRSTRRANTRRTANSVNNFYTGYNDVRSIYGGSDFAAHDGSSNISQVVPASTSDDDVNLAFFKRNKTNNEETPVTPAPTNNPQIPKRTNRVNPVSQPAPATPVPTSMNDSWYDDFHDLDEAADDGYNSSYDGSENLQPVPTSEPTKVNPERVGQRLMK